MGATKKIAIAAGGLGLFGFLGAMDYSDALTQDAMEKEARPQRVIAADRLAFPLDFKAIGLPALLLRRARDVPLLRGAQMTLTKSMVYAAGRDAGNRSMREAGRTVWAVKDYNAACAEFARLIPFANCNYTVEAARYELATRK